MGQFHEEHETAVRACVVPRPRFQANNVYTDGYGCPIFMCFTIYKVGIFAY